MPTTDTPKPSDTAGQPCEGLPAEFCSGTERQRRAVQASELRAMLIRHAIISHDVEDDPEGYDGHITWNNVAAFAMDLQATLFPNDLAQTRRAGD